MVYVEKQILKTNHTSIQHQKWIRKHVKKEYVEHFQYPLNTSCSVYWKSVLAILIGFSMAIGVVFFDCQSRDYVTLDVIIILRIWQIFLDEDKWINGSMAEFCLKYFLNYFFFFWNFGSFCCPFFGIMLKEILLEYVLTEKYSLVWHN